MVTGSAETPSGQPPCLGRGAWLRTLSVALVLGTPGLASAQVPGLSVTWIAPPECPNLAELERVIQALLGDPLNPAGGRSLEAQVQVEQRANGRWRADVVVAGASSGRRRLEGGSCGAVLQASAVVIALALEPGARVEATAEPPARAEPAPPPAPIEGPPLSPFMLAFAGAVVGALPGLAPEFGAGVGLRRGRWQTQLTLAYAPEQDARVGSSSEGAGISRWTATASGCFAVIATRPITSGLCLGAAVERLTAQASGVARPGQGSTLLLSPLLALKSETRLSSHWSLVLAATGVVRPHHPRFVVDYVRPVYAIPVVGGSLEGGLQFAF